MKSTYKILSSQLDGKPIAKNIPLKSLSQDDEKRFCITSEYNLFDYPYCKRVIDGSMLLTKDCELISEMIEEIGVLREVIVKIDYYSPLVTVNRLCLKRILQAIEQLRWQHGEVIFTLVIEQEKYDEVKLLIEQIQNAM